MAVDDAFAREDLAELYDSLNPSDTDHRFYLALSDTTSRILDIGCGTGELALALAAAGHEVTAVDPAPACCRWPGRRIWSVGSIGLRRPDMSFA
jgi:2-polyprenyl-3-methyl-5-hydroxy-6-metoxy-1,4-benzoquinol methylase